MILKRLRLENIRSYTRGDITFQNGVVLLSGDIGSGKSTILHGIEFALFGILRGDLEGGALLRHGKTEGTVELDFEIDGKSVTIRRNLKKGASGIKQEAGHIIINGVQIDGTPVELKTKVLSLLGYPDELLTKSKSIYRYTVYTPQEAMKHILSDEREARLDTLRRVFGIDKYKRINENLSIIMKKIREDKKEIQGKISDLPLKNEELSDKEKRLSDITQKIQRINPMQTACKEKINLCTQALVGIEKDIESVVEMKRQRGALSARLEERARERAALEKEIATAQNRILEETKKADSIQIPDTSIDAKSIESELAKKEEERHMLANKKTAVFERLSSIGRDIASRKEIVEKKKAEGLLEAEELFSMIKEKLLAKPALEQRLTKLNNVAESFAKVIGEHDFKKSEVDRISREIAHLDSCPLCLQPVSLHHKREIAFKHSQQLAELNAAIKKLSSEKEPHDSSLAALKKELEEMNTLERDLAALEVRIDAGRKERAEGLAAAKELEALIRKKDELERESAGLSDEAMTRLDALIKASKASLHSANENLAKSKMRDGILSVIIELQRRKSLDERKILDSTEEIGRLNANISALDALIDAKKDLESKFLALKKEMDALVEEEKRHSVELAGFAREKELLSEACARLREEVLAKEAAKLRFEKLGALTEFLDEHFANLVLSMERHIMASIHRKFADFFGKWFSLLVEDEMIACRLDSDFSPVAIQNGYENDISNLSGGEKTAVALAYRLSLNKVINDMISTIKTRDLLILDEPTDGFSEEQLDRVRDVLDELNLAQVIMVSHEPKMEGFCDSVVRIQKRGHESGTI